MENATKSGQVIEYYDDGIVKSLSYYEDNLLEGTKIEYYETGMPASVKRYLNDKLDGSCITYNRNGNILSQGKFVDGSANGVFKEYFENGSIKTIKHYENKFLNGWCIDFFQDNYEFENLKGLDFTQIPNNADLSIFNGINHLKEISFMVEGAKNGPCIRFDSKGNTVSVGLLKHGYPTNGWTKINKSVGTKTICNYDGPYLKEAFHYALSPNKLLTKEEFEMKTEIEILRAPKNDLIDFDIYDSENNDVDSAYLPKLKTKIIYNSDGTILDKIEFDNN